MPFFGSFVGKREATGGGYTTGISPGAIGGPPKAVNNTAGYVTAPSGGANMIPEDTIPDEEFALAITQKTQVR